MRSNTGSLVFWTVLTVATMAFAVPASAARPDPWITTKAKIALIGDPDVRGLKVDVDTVNGRVTLHGDVASNEEKAEAERIVRGIDGVTDVRNMLQIKPGDVKTTTAKVDDATLQDRVEQTMDKDPALAGSHIDVASVDNGIVTLKGEARTMSEHRRALEKARSVDGVKEVRSSIKAPEDLRNEEVWNDTERQAEGAAHDASKTAKTAASDAGSAAKDMWITTATKVRLIADDKTPAVEINVDTRDGVVTLFGMVPSEQAKRASETEARKVSGVISVRNELEIVPSKMQDQVQAKDDDLKDAVSKHIDARADLKNDHVDVEVSNGVARLTGEVDSQSERLSALTTARSVPGIRAVIAELKVKPSGDASISADRERIEKEDRMERNRDTDPYDGDAENDAGDAPLH